MNRLAQSLTRTSAFLRKEIYEIVRQPRLLMALVLGPFLILLIFGIGYRNVPRPLRTLFVIQENSALKSELKQYATTLGPQLVFAGVTSDESQALSKLKKGEVDLVAVAPKNAYQTIQDNQQAVFTLYHREIDPLQVNYVTYFGKVYMQEVNRRILVALIQQEKGQATNVDKDLQSAHDNLDKMRQALKKGDIITAHQHLGDLSKNINDLSTVVGGTLTMLDSIDQNLGSVSNSGASALLALLSDVRQNADALNTLSAASSASPAELDKLNQIEKDLNAMDAQIHQFTGVNANVILQPFRSETKSINKVQPTDSDFFAPAVIALLLQHLAVTLAALSIVQEHTVGTMELFRVSPLSAGETLLGKYLSYMIFGVLLAVVLTLVLVFGLKIPMLGSWVQYLLVVAALLFASLGIGFVISLISKNDTQAVQLTMLVLLTSVFFSGFMMNLNMIWRPVRVLSWSLPTTYGIAMLRDIFLRGSPANPVLLEGLLGIGVFMCLLAWVLLRRLIPRR
jgi:ABC-2 type transport system permease protein